MQKVLAVAAAAAFGLSASHAEAMTTFQFSTSVLPCQTGESQCGVLDGTDGNSRKFTQDGITVTVKGFRYIDNSPSGSSASDARQKAFLGRFTGGLGVTNQLEGSGSNNRHVVDNLDKFDFVEFVFSVPVKPTQVKLTLFGDSDISFNQGDFRSPQTVMDGPTTATHDLPSSLVFNTTFNLFAEFNSTDRDDKFKVLSLTVTPVPIPAALPLFGAALAGLGGMAWRNRKTSA